MTVEVKHFALKADLVELIWMCRGLLYMKKGRWKERRGERTKRRSKGMPKKCS